MVDLTSVLQAEHLHVFVGTAALLGGLHTLLGPDHYVPFVAMAKAEKWSRPKALRIVALCGFGHVAGSAILGALLVAAGMRWTAWDNAPGASLQALRGDLAAWLLVGLGAALLAWGLVQAYRGRSHAHVHAHEDGIVHVHPHSHRGTHLHVHATRSKSLSPWLLFVVLVFGPCESLIPLMLASAALFGWWGAFLVTCAFGLATLVAMLGATATLLAGTSRIRLPSLERWSTALAGLCLLLCGAAVQWLGW